MSLIGVRLVVLKHHLWWGGGDQNQRWVKFTYVGRESRYITKLFRNTSLKVAYTTNNNLGKLLEMQETQKPNKFDKNGVYQLMCQTCRKKYVGQTGRPLHVRFREHYRL